MIKSITLALGFAWMDMRQDVLEIEVSHGLVGWEVGGSTAAAA